MFALWALGDYPESVLGKCIGLRLFSFRRQDFKAAGKSTLAISTFLYLEAEQKLHLDVPRHQGRIFDGSTSAHCPLNHIFLKK